MTAEARRGQFGAWLSKKKSGSSVVRLRQYNKRFFTLDFDTRSFYYTHNEGSHKVCHPVNFCDLVDVHTFSPMAEQASDDASVCSKQSKMSLLKRVSSFGKDREDVEQHMLTVLVKPDKRMELMCASAGEAAEWVSALREAIAMGSGEAGSGIVGSGSSQPSQANSPQAGSGYPTPAAEPAPSKPPLAPAAAGGPEAVEARRTGSEGSSGPGGDASEGVGAAIAAAVEAPEKRTFMSFEAIEEEVRPGEESARDAQAPGEAVTEVSAAGAATMQAEDFGFGADEDQASSCSSSSSGGTPRGSGGGAAVAAVTAASPLDAAAGSPSMGAPSPVSPSPGGEPRSSYKDKDEGKTMQERLANLEFSDDEEEDDDPFGLKQAKAETG